MKRIHYLTITLGILLLLLFANMASAMNQGARAGAATAAMAYDNDVTREQNQHEGLREYNQVFNDAIDGDAVNNPQGRTLKGKVLDGTMSNDGGLTVDGGDSNPIGITPGGDNNSPGRTTVESGSTKSDADRLLTGGKTDLEGGTDSEMVNPYSDPIMTGGMPDTPVVRDASSVLRVQDKNPDADVENTTPGLEVLPIGDGTSVIIR